MTEALSPNSQAVLLLTAPLITDRPRNSSRSAQAKLLTAGEYGKLAVRLHSMSVEPADLLKPDADRLLAKLADLFDFGQLRDLLGRGFLLAQAADRWRTRAIWVLSRADDGYPAHLRAVLKKDAPALLYGCGQGDIMGKSGLAIVGSRDAGDSSLAYAGDVAARVVATGRVVVSGGARGVDQAAMNGALSAGGQAIGVLADRLEKTSMNREHRNLVLDGRLLLVSPYDPQAGFHVGQAMQRNKVIYALADAGLVVETAVESGGTWTGAVEQLQKYSRTVFVRSSGVASEGLRALLALGAKPWPEDADEAGLEATLGPCLGPVPHVDAQAVLPLEPVGVQANPVAPDANDPCVQELTNYGEELYRTVRSLVLEICAEPRSAAEVADSLGVPKSASDRWLRRLVEEQIVTKEKAPVRYVARQRSLPGLSN